MYAISQPESVSPATVRLTPSTDRLPFSATKRWSARGIASVTRRPSPSAATARTSPTPSTWPCTRCPPSRSASRSERSRLTGVPSRQSPSVVRRSVSGTASTAKRPLSTATAVRQQPEQLMLSPTFASAKTSPAAIQSRRPSGRSSACATRRFSSMSPVTPSALQVHDEAEVVADQVVRDDPAARRARECPIDPVAAGEPAPEDERRRLEHEPLHEPGAEEGRPQRGAALEQHRSEERRVGKECRARWRPEH